MNQLELFATLNTASSVCLLSTNGDLSIGQPTNHLLAAVNRSAKLRYIQSVHEDIDNNPTIEKILFEFGSNARHSFTYDNKTFSCLIIDDKIVLEKNGDDEIVQYLIDDTTAAVKLQKFESFWSDASDEAKIKSIKQLIKSVIGAKLKRGDFLFRGQCNHEWKLTPTLLRKYTGNEPQIEANYLKPLFHRNRTPFLYTVDPLEYLINCQHYGIQTRLLDFTRDVLVSLFFACFDPNSEYEDRDGKVYIIDRKQFVEIDLPSNSAFEDRVTKENLKDFKSRIYVEYPTIIEPIIKNPRIRSQDGLLILFPYFAENGNYLSLEGYIKHWNKDIIEEEKKYWILHKLVDRKFKKYLLKELKHEHGISEETIITQTNSSKKAVEDFYFAIENPSTF